MTPNERTSGNGAGAVSFDILLVQALSGGISLDGIEV